MYLFVRLVIVDSAHNNVYIVVRKVIASILYHTIALDLIYLLVNGTAFESYIIFIL